MRIVRAPAARAFSLIELLCVTVIIGILAGLLLTAVTAAYGRAKRMQREFEWPAYIEQVRDRLTSFCERQPLYPALTPQQLQELGVFDGRIMDFLRSRGVTFHPFTFSDPANKIVLEVRFSKENLHLLLKSDLRRPEE